MGLLRGLWRTSGLGRTIDTIKNITEEGSVSGGIKRTIKEDITEDNPITAAIYNSGKHDGKKEGYVEASQEYEKKLIDQANKFLTQKKIYEYERDQYEKLLDEYEREIQVLCDKVNKTEEENQYLQQLLIAERQLRKLTVVVEP